MIIRATYTALAAITTAENRKHACVKKLSCRRLLQNDARRLVPAGSTKNEPNERCQRDREREYDQ